MELNIARRNGLIKHRRALKDAPLMLNMKNYFFNHTRIGRLSAKSSDFFHNLGKKMILWIEYKLSLHHWKRRFVVPGVFFGGLIYGYVILSDIISGNMYER